MILVDAAIWPWRDRKWAHLVSDSNLAELHQFAARIGLRRAAFQGDHYDIDERRRLEALASGAQAVDSRELVRRLRSAGLRTRQGLTPWDVLERFGTESAADAMQRLSSHMKSDLAGGLVADVVAAAESAAVGQRRQRGAAAKQRPLAHLEGLVLQRPGELLISLSGSGTGHQPIAFETSAHVHLSWDPPVRTVEILFTR